MSEAAPTTQAPTFKDSRTWLIVGGNLLILFGVLNLLSAIWGIFTAIMYMAMGMSEAGGGRDAGLAAAWNLTSGIGSAGSATIDIWLGIGSILCTRWAQKLIWIGAWVWACLVFFVMLLMAYAMVEVAPLLREISGDMPAVLMGMFMLGMLLVYGLFSLIPAIAFGWLYGTDNVRLTCEWRDTKPRWTDRVPPLVLATGILGFFSVLYTPVFMVLGIFPYAGMLFTGMASTAMWALFILGSIYAIWGLARLQRAAWLLALVMTLGLGAPVAMTVGSLDYGAIISSYLGENLMPGFDDPMSPPDPNITYDIDDSAPYEDEELHDMLAKFTPAIQRFMAFSTWGTFAAFLALLACIAPHFFRQNKVAQP